MTPVRCAAVTPFVIAPGDPRVDDVRALLAVHLAHAFEHSPPEDVHALDLDGLLAPSITFYSARRDGELIAIGALKELDPTHGELKSMHTVAAVRRQGVGRAMVDHLVAEAIRRGYARVSLETGAGAAYDGARALYAACGFVPCEPFGDYRPSPYSAFMARVLRG